LGVICVVGLCGQAMRKAAGRIPTALGPAVEVGGLLTR
jgi:hypothetical protein